jgi:NAD(P)-dependent dehydrogenase (short-subunit alcohol dehydrogenase family)
MDLTGKVALVTGAARRVGRAIALALAGQGADVAVHYRSSEADAEETVRQIRAAGRRGEMLQADLADPGQIPPLFARLGEVFGGLDVLVNNAAVFGRTPLETLTAEQWDSQLAVNARAAALCIRHASALMKRRGGGAIVNITDVSADKCWAGYPAYCASKAALGAVTRSAALALAADGIRVNAVAPGAIEWAQGQTQQDKDVVLQQIPMGRIGCPRDIAAAVVFLCEADYITSQTLRVDGGWHMG